MSGPAAAATVAQVAGGVALAPLLPGLVQSWKARLQGRRGPSPLQPYRDLRRLWGKSAVDVEGAGFVYRFAPAVAAASLAAAVLLVPVTSDVPDLGVGRDALVLAGLLALARFAVAASAWEVANGFALMGASAGSVQAPVPAPGRIRRSRSARSRSRWWSSPRRDGSRWTIPIPISSSR